MFSKEEISPVEEIKSIDILDFLRKNNTLSLSELVELFLRIAKEARDSVSQEYIYSEIKNKPDKLILKNFMGLIKEKVVEICFSYLFVKPYDFVEGKEYDPKNELLQKLCQKKLTADIKMIEVCETVIAWFNQDEVFKANINSFPSESISETWVTALGKSLIDSLQKSNPEEKKNARKRKWDELVTEVKSNTENLTEKVDKLKKFRLNNEEVNKKQLADFEKFIKNAMNFIFSEKIRSSIMSLCKSTLKENLQDSYGNYLKGKNANKSLVASYKLSKSGLTMTIDKTKIKDTLEQFKLNDSEYDGYAHVDNRYTIFVTNHEKIIRYFISNELEPGIMYGEANVNWQEMIRENHIDLSQPQFEKIDDKGNLIEQPAKYPRLN